MENKQKKYLHLLAKISENSVGNFDKSKIKIIEEFDINDKTYLFLKNNNKIISDKNQSSKENSEYLLFCVRPIKGEYIQIENNFPLIMVCNKRLS